MLNWRIITNLCKTVGSVSSRNLVLEFVSYCDWEWSIVTSCENWRTIIVWFVLKICWILEIELIRFSRMWKSIMSLLFCYLVRLVGHGYCGYKLEILMYGGNGVILAMSRCECLYYHKSSGDVSLRWLFSGLMNLLCLSTTRIGISARLNSWIHACWNLLTTWLTRLVHFTRSCTNHYILAQDSLFMPRTSRVNKILQCVHPL